MTNRRLFPISGISISAFWVLEGRVDLGLGVHVEKRMPVIPLLDCGYLDDATKRSIRTAMLSLAARSDHRGWILVNPANKAEMIPARFFIGAADTILHAVVENFPELSAPVIDVGLTILNQLGLSRPTDKLSTRGVRHG